MHLTKALTGASHITEVTCNQKVLPQITNPSLKLFSSLQEHLGSQSEREVGLVTPQNKAIKTGVIITQSEEMNF